MKESCENCYYWKSLFELSNNPYRGMCRRYPPTIISNGTKGSQFELFPTTLDDAWCGEYLANYLKEQVKRRHRHEK